MRLYRATASTAINAPADEVFAILADYRDGHQRILPRPPFEFLHVEEGGFGAGTRIRFAMRVGGKSRTSRAVITEPEPGRVLVETDEEQQIVTTFTVSPSPSGADVTITTEGQTRGGPLGWLEGTLIPAYLRRVYRQELTLLAALAEQREGMAGEKGMARHAPTV